MAQIKIPAEFPLQLALLADIILKNNDPDTDNLLTDWLTEKEIDLAADKTAGDDAEKQESTRATQDAASKMAFTSRDNNMELVFKFVRAAAQVLKKFYPTNYATLRDWGIPITDSGRIVYPSSFEERNSIAAALFTKLASFPEGKSPLQAYIKTNKVDVAALSTKNSDAAKSNTAANVAAKIAENATEQRNLLWETPLKHIREIGDYLKSIYPDNPRALGEWGFEVDEAERKATLRKTKLIIAETITIKAVSIGGILTNTGEEDILVDKGFTITDQAIIVKAGGKLGMVKGYSTITVSNPSSLKSAEFTVEIRK